DNVLFDFVASGSNQPVLDKRYFYGTGVDRVLAQESAQGGVLWSLTDQLGTVKDFVDNSGSVANHVRYDAFGGVVSQSNSAAGSRYGFTGRELDSETGLYYYRARYYNSEIGRFIGEDSVGFASKDTNLYAYVTNNPIEAIDPFGLTKRGKVDSQLRLINYFDGDNNSPEFTNTIESISNDASNFILSDLTIARISPTDDEAPGGTLPNKNKIKSIQPIGDDRGHIVANKELGGSNRDINNFFPQNSSINQGRSGTWRAFESNLGREIVKKNNDPNCPRVNLILTINLVYLGRTIEYPLRPSSYVALGVFTDGTIYGPSFFPNPL
ncbi:RHS repeat-associated core domain-containing protein, partial [Microcoleus sp. B13-B6]|uniref:RHS repeat-associated core domain-containing protein n=2 Tax=Microcoleus TaxID=44471 RepID=UPI002FD6EB5A